MLKNMYFDHRSFSVCAAGGGRQTQERHVYSETVLTDLITFSQEAMCWLVMVSELLFFVAVKSWNGWKAKNCDIRFIKKIRKDSFIHSFKLHFICGLLACWLVRWEYHSGMVHAYSWLSCF